MRAYIAGRYDRREELLGYAKTLQDAGVEITSRWVFGEHDTGALDEAGWAKFAAEDIHDVARADTVISFTESPDFLFKRGGMHVEFGFALATGKQLIIIGEKQNIFHHLPNVIQFKSFGEFLFRLKDENNKV